MSFVDHLQLALCDLHISFNLKGEQKRALEAIYNGEDVFCLLKTGFGKSLIYQLSPFLLSRKTGNENLFVIVLSPLNSIMKDQVRQMCMKGVKACYLDMLCKNGETYMLKGAATDMEDAEDEYEMSEENEETSDDGLIESSVQLNDIENSGSFKILYCHPEALLSSRAGQALARSKHFRRNVCCVAIDEAHMIQEWGVKFRPDFGRLQEILGLYSSVPVIVLTATASVNTQQLLIKDLGLRSPRMVIANPNRENIMFHKLLRSKSENEKDDLDDILSEILSGLLEERTDFPLTLVYTDLETIQYSYRYIEEGLGQHQYEGEPIPENRIFAMYHQNYTEKLKDHIVKEISKPNSKIRLIFATVALGMGINAPEIRKVIHFKSPTSLEKYIQETGRAILYTCENERVIFQYDLRIYLCITCIV